MREQFPVEWICDKARELVETAETESVRLRALEIIAERAHGKVTDRHEVVMGAPDDEDDGIELLTDAELDALETLRRQQDELLERGRERRALDGAGDTRVTPYALPAGSSTVIDA